MTTNIHWQIDTAAEPARAEPALRPALPGAIRDLRRPTQNRFDYYAQIAVAAEQTGFDGVYLPHRRESDDSRITAAVLAREVPRLKLLAEFPASTGSAVYAAKQATTFQRGAQGRLDWVIAPDADVATRAAEGDFASEDELGQRLEEFLVVARGVHGRQGFSFKGAHFEVENGGFADPLSRVRFPRVFLQGESEEALSLSARLADVHLFHPRPLAALGGLIEALDNAAKRAGRQVGFGLVQPVLARETGEDAIRDAGRIALPPGAIVGDWDEVAEALAARVSLGIEHLVLAAPQQLEDAYAIGQHLLPRLRARIDSRRHAA